VPSRYPAVLTFKALRALRVLGACRAPAAALSAALRRGGPGHAGNPACVDPQEFLMTARTVSVFTEQQRRIVEALRPIVGPPAASLYEANGRSLQKLAYFARDSSLPGCRRLTTSLSLAQALLAEEMSDRPVFDSPTAVVDYLKLHFAGQPYESFVVMYLDAQHRLIAVEDLFRGTIAQTSVYPREIARRALHHNAAALVVAHNHPSGAAEPSRADEALTSALKASLSLLDVRVLDHLVIAGSQATSLAQRGLM
jgi:DNA repair protein RadC